MPSAPRAFVQPEPCGVVHLTLLLRKNSMKIKQFILSSVVAFASLAVLAPSMASAAPAHGHKAHAHKVCKWEAHRHQRVCRWVR